MALRAALVWIGFITSLLTAAVLITKGRLAWGLAALALPLLVTGALTGVYYARERRKGKREMRDTEGPGPGA